MREAAQLALQVEFATIPPYLTALYSITDKSSKAYKALRSVAIEEMFHCNQAANIIVALGALPKFTGDAAPIYPTYLPKANPENTPFIGLNRASIQVFNDVFSEIENPAPAGAPAQGNCYDTIAQLYDALVEAVKAYPGNPFEHKNSKGRQRTDIYIGSGGGDAIEVVDKESFYKAVNEIVKQGEGSVPVGKPLVPVEPFGAYNHYGQRTDGTYGPILGTPYELSHFIKFRQVALDTANFPNVLPIISNPGDKTYENEKAEKLALAFDRAYSIMLNAFERVFEAGVTPELYFGFVLNIMHGMLPNLALSLMATPAFEHGNGSVGPNATPRWLYKPNVRFSQLNQEIQQQIDRLSASDDDSAIRGPLQTAFESVQEINATAESLGL